MKRLLVCLLVFTACEPPGVYPTADRRQNTELSRIEGSVVVSSKARGNVVVLLFDAARLPPPAGSGRPVTFTVLSSAEVFGSAPEATIGPDGGTVVNSGPFTAPFAFSLVPAGRYQLRGFVDSNEDFIPWYDVTSQVNAGDVGGSAIEPSTRTSREIVVEVKSPTLNVPVSFADTSLVPVDRPSFAVTGMPSLALTPTGGTKMIELQLLPITQGVIHQGRPAFLAKFIDDNGDGAPDDSNQDGVPDLWPKVLVRKLSNGSNPLLDENDLDKNGVLDPTGEDYEHINPMNGITIAADGKPDAVVLAAAIDPTDLAPMLLDPMTQKVLPSPVPVTKLKLVLKPQAFDISNPAAPQVLKVMPKGRYAITLIQITGQTWRLPNELQTGIAEKFGLPVLSSQSFFVEVP